MPISSVSAQAFPLRCSRPPDGQPIKVTVCLQGRTIRSVVLANLSPSLQVSFPLPSWFLRTPRPLPPPLLPLRRGRCLRSISLWEDLLRPLPPPGSSYTRKRLPTILFSQGRLLLSATALARASRGTSQPASVSDGILHYIIRTRLGGQRL